MATPMTSTHFVGDMSRCQSRVNVYERLQPEYFDREVKSIFRRSWLPVASLSDLKENNSFVATDIPTLNASLLVMRGADGAIRAFHNACRHRGNRLAPEGSKGCKAALTCMFHGWTFATDGRLIGVTDKTQFPDLSPEDTGLIPVHAEVWEDYVFVNFDANPTVSLRDWLGKLYGEYTGYFAGRQRLGSYRIEVACNWNPATNSFTEGYHSAFLHKDSVPDYQGGKGNPMRHRPYLEVTERHGRYSAKSNPNHKMTPVEDLAYKFGRKMFPAFPHISEIGEQPPGVNPGRNEWWAFDVLELFPCTVVIMGAHWHATMWFWPIDEHRTDIRIEYFGYKAKTVGDHLAHAYFRVRNREVFREDVGTMEACGKTLRAGAMQEVILSQQEMLIQNHYRVATEMAGPPGQEHGRTSQPVKIVQRSAA